MKEAPTQLSLGDGLVLLLDTMIAPVGLCALESYALIWANPPLQRILAEHRLPSDVSIRSLTTGLPPPGPALSRFEATFPSAGTTRSLTASCQFGPILPLGEDEVLLFRAAPHDDSNLAQATLNIFSRHLNVRQESWDSERAALLDEIETLKAQVDANIASARADDAAE
jgi:hypothetical protein